eukprot:CAMPEP_0176478722 /NCGR_PEP_ID=MMETSP0200_2-20121128/1340_1 /TAXON_ID=947934 /ORGANISM="Chaetoceros sp., Strain GSL56" /LENGTH=358 /DNA_ID=CAMNT_0017874683 /DNA_START=284 /DNA_END=1357 /DNA_ORIENTATION=+
MDNINRNSNSNDMIHNSNQDENDDVSSQYYAAHDALDLMMCPDRVHERTFEALPSMTRNNNNNTNNIRSLVSSSTDHSTHDGYPVQSDLQQEPTRTTTTIQSWKEYMIEFYKKDSLLIDVLLAIFIAKLYPRLGAELLFPEITAHWVAVIVIFYLSGFAMRMEQLSEAASNWKFNSFVIGYNFIGISFVVTIVANYFARNEIVSEDLMKGMIICSCLSMPTNLMLVLSVSSNGDEAVALFLATIMNLIGVIITPLLVFLYLQENAEIDFVSTYKSISLRVLLPVTCGIISRLKIPGADRFAMEKRQFFVKIREKCLIYIIYATFCTTFVVDTDSTRSQILIMALSQVILLSASMVLAW